MSGEDVLRQTFPSFVLVVGLSMACCWSPSSSLFRILAREAVRLTPECTMQSEFWEFRLSPPFPFRFPRTHRQLKSSSWSSPSLAAELLRRQRSSISISSARSLSVGLSITISPSLSTTTTTIATNPGCLPRLRVDLSPYLCSCCPPACQCVCALLDRGRACSAHGVEPFCHFLGL